MLACSQVICEVKQSVLLTMAHECCCGDALNKRYLPIGTTGSIVPALGLALKFFSPLPEGLSSSDTGCTPETDQQHIFTVPCYKKKSVNGLKYKCCARQYM